MKKITSISSCLSSRGLLFPSNPFFFNISCPLILDLPFPQSHLASVYFYIHATNLQNCLVFLPPGVFAHVSPPNPLFPLFHPSLSLLCSRSAAPLWDFPSDTWSEAESRTLEADWLSLTSEVALSVARLSITLPLFLTMISSLLLILVHFSLISSCFYISVTPDNSLFHTNHHYCRNSWFIRREDVVYFWRVSCTFSLSLSWLLFCGESNFCNWVVMKSGLAESKNIVFHFAICDFNMKSNLNNKEIISHVCSEWVPAVFITCNIMTHLRVIVIDR